MVYSDLGDMFPIKELPFELRALIYPHALILQHDNSAPPLLLALAADTGLYAEAQLMYQKINATVTSKNQDVFGKLKMGELMKIRHLRFMFPGPYVPRHYTPFRSYLAPRCLVILCAFSWPFLTSWIVMPLDPTVFKYISLSSIIIYSARLSISPPWTRIRANILRSAIKPHHILLILSNNC